MTAAQPLRLARGLIADADPAATDGELLRRYAETRDEAAFAELVRRNGPLVLRACRSVLGPSPAAEDAFQAAFLLLVRKAAALGKAGSLAGWLHAASVRTARTARRSEDRRRKREQTRTTPATASPDDLTWREVRERLDVELAALPEKYRLPLVLCYLQELTYEDAARRAGCSVGALRGRLERGKERLRRRLATYGLPLAAPVLVLGRPTTVSAALSETTLTVTRAGLTGGAIPPAVAALLVSTVRVKVVAVASAVLAVLGFALAGATGNPPTGDPKPEATAAALAADGAPTDPLGDPLPPGAVMRLGTRRFQVASWPIEPISLPGGKQYLLYDRQPGRSSRYEFSWMDAVSGVVTARWAPFETLHAAGVSADGRWLVMAETQFEPTGIRFGGMPPPPPPKTGPIKFALYDLTTRNPVKEFVAESDEVEGNRVQVTGACISADAKWIVTVSGSHDKTGRVRLWEVATGQVVWASEYKQRNDPMFTPIGFTPGAAELVLRRSDNRWVHLVDVAKAKEVRTFATISDQIQGETLAPDGSAVLITTYKPDVSVFDLKTGAERTLGGHKEWARQAVFTPDGKTLVTGGNDPFLLVRDWPSGAVRKRIDLDPRAVNRLYASADGKFVDVLYWWERSLARYDLATGKRVERPADTHRAEVFALTLTPDGHVMSVGHDGTLRTWNLATGRQVRQSPAQRVSIHDPFTLTPDGKVRREGSLSPDGRFFAGAGAEKDTVNVFDARTNAVVASFGGKGGWWGAGIETGFSPDGNILATSTEGFVQLREVGSWRARGGIKVHATGFDFSPDGRSLLCAGLNDVTVWEVATQKLRYTLRPGPQGLSRPRFSPDGRLIAWAEYDGSVMLRDLFRDRTVARFLGHDDRLMGYVFTPDGRRLVTASDDCTLLVWDVAGPAARVKPADPPDEQDLRAAADDLASSDGVKAFAAVRMLAAGGETSVGVIRGKLRPAAATDAAAVKQLLTDLDSDDFATREKATAALIALGERAEGPVYGLLAGQPSPEARRRAAQVLEGIAGPVTSADRLREVRAVEVLEWVATPAAKEVLRELAKGDPSAGLTRDATATLRRLEKR
jgi:RNA polymerase sigma factor (sigma-70 family)